MGYQVRGGKNYFLRFHRGRHFKEHEMQIFKDGKTVCAISTAALFLPQQLTSEERVWEKGVVAAGAERRYTLPYGGDLYSFNAHPPDVSFLILDTAGHGFACHKLTEHLIMIARRRQGEQQLAVILGNEWLRETEKEKSEVTAAVKQEMQRAIEAAKRLGDDEKALGRHERELEGLTHLGMMSACEVHLDIESRKIEFSNYGHPDQYCIILDNQGNVLHWYDFSNQAKMLGVMEEKSKSKTVQLDQKWNSFRLVLFSDAILEQTIDVGDAKQIWEVIRRIGLEEEYRQFHAEEEGARRDFSRNHHLLIETIKRMCHHSPKEFVQFFYRYLIHHNKEAQGDDVTMVVSDISFLQ